jgi:chlorite dismutase
MTREIPPETTDGWVVFHQMFTVNSTAVAEQGDKSELRELAEDMGSWIQGLEEFRPGQGHSAAFRMLGHRAQFMLINFASSFEQCVAIEQHALMHPLMKYLNYTGSYLSVVELGMYVVTHKAAEKAKAEGLEPESDEFRAKVQEMVTPHRERLLERAFGPIPEGKYVCFYPMSKRRGEQENWYRRGLDERSALMTEHGMTGRRYAGKVKQIISGSMGLDDWEWAVDLFSDDLLPIKQLVSEMRFDEVTSRYGEFGMFLLGVRAPACEFARYFLK